MTAQAGERLVYKGRNIWMASEPLYEYLKDRGDIKFVSIATNCWRGYFGDWEISGNKLYLNGVKGYAEGYKRVDLDYLFPGQSMVFAKWFSGEIRIPQGKLLEYEHMGFESIYEEDLMLTFEDGVLIGEHIIDNRTESLMENLQRREKETPTEKKERSFWDRLFGRR